VPPAAAAAVVGDQLLQVHAQHARPGGGVANGVGPRAADQRVVVVHGEWESVLECLRSYYVRFLQMESYVCATCRRRRDTGSASSQTGSSSGR
jgi:hypothetical protein